MWTRYKVTWQFMEKLCGSVPLNPDMIKPWLEQRFKKHTAIPPGSRSLTEITEEVLGSLSEPPEDKEAKEEAEKQSTLGFQQIDGKLVMRGGTVKAHLKDCSRIVAQFVGKLRDEKTGKAIEKGFDWKILNCVNVEDYWIPILRDGKAVAEPDDYFDKAVHAKVWRGGRVDVVNCLKRICYIEKPTMEFYLKVLTIPKGPVVSKADIESLMEYSGTHGYAGERGDGEGRYLTKIEEVKDGEHNKDATKVTKRG